MFIQGITQAFISALLSGFFFLYIRASTALFDVNAITFTVMSMVATALTLSFIAGPGRYVSSTLKSWQSWFYGFCLIGTYVLDLLLVAHVSGTETGLLNRMTIPASVIAVYLIFRRKPNHGLLIGNSIVVLGLGIMIALQGWSIWQNIWIITILVVVFNISETLVAETHKEYDNANQKGNFRDRVRVLAFVSFITAVLFFVACIGLSVLKEGGLALPEFIPPLAAYIHAPSLLAGLGYGLLFAPANRYLQWAAVTKIKSENVLAIMALVPMFVFMWEWLFGLFFPLSLASQPATGWLFLATLLVSVGALLSILLQMPLNLRAECSWASFKTEFKKAFRASEISSIQHIASAEDDYEIICATLEHTGGNQEQAAELLNIPHDTLHVLYEGKGTLALTAGASQEVSRRYRKHVANRDALTGVLNRSGFMTEVKKLLGNVKSANIFFIDLDKFKPVNDTYGHEAGDKVLQGVASRLSKMLPEGGIVTRLGGDEFCILLPNITATVATKTVTKIQQTIAKPFKFNGINDAINISASVGTSRYPKDSVHIDELLKLADGGMYREKSAR